jgi:hypothetical protein
MANCSEWNEECDLEALDDYDEGSNEPEETEPVSSWGEALKEFKKQDSKKYFPTKVMVTFSTDKGVYGIVAPVKKGWKVRQYKWRT